MYPLTCNAGYPMPVRAGKFEVFAMSATVATLANDSRVKLIDDRGITDVNFGRILPNTFVGPTEIIDVKNIGNGSGTVEASLAEPVKVRNGISVAIADNIVAGSLKLFVR